MGDKSVFLLLLASLAGILAWGYASGDMRQLAARPDPSQTAAHEQRALDHLFGSDQLFDATADNVTATAKGTQDTLSWKSLSQARLKMNKATPVGVDYLAAVKALDGRDVTITGYMFPLEAAQNQNHFLLSAYPPSCPYCLPAAPSELIDIVDSPIPFTYDRVTLQGKIHLASTPEQCRDGLFYHMSKARLVRQ